MSHDFYIPDAIHGPKDNLGYPIPLCRRCGEWTPNALPSCPSNQQEIVSPESLIGVTFEFQGINASLTTLSDKRGFRNFIKGFCDSKQIRGYIFRKPTTSAEIYVEGSKSQITEFRDFITQMLDMGMIEIFIFVSEKSINSYSRSTAFHINRNSSRFAKNGPYSSNEYDKVSEYSADREPFFEAPSPHSSDK